MKVTGFGAGVVGLVTACCLPETGNSIVCLDVDADRVAPLRQDRIPIHEPGPDDLAHRKVLARRLGFSTDVEAVVAHGMLIFIAVGTPAVEDFMRPDRVVLGCDDERAGAVRRPRPLRPMLATFGFEQAGIGRVPRPQPAAAGRLPHRTAGDTSAPPGAVRVNPAACSR